MRDYTCGCFGHVSGFRSSMGLQQGGGGRFSAYGFYVGERGAHRFRCDASPSSTADVEEMISSAIIFSLWQSEHMQAKDSFTIFA